MESSDRQKSNGARLYRLLIDKGTEAMRKVFDKIHPPTSLSSVLKNCRKPLNSLRVINKTQMDILYPPSGTPSSSQNYDITLLFILLRNICGLSPPTSTGSKWDLKPPTSDKSLEADLARIKYYRNMLYGHITSTSVSNVEFEQSWTEISEVLERLGMDAGDLQYLKTAPLEDNFYTAQLIEWKESEEKIDTELRKISNKQDKQYCLLSIIAILLVVLIAAVITYHFYFSSENLSSTSQFRNMNDSTFVGRRWLFQELEDRFNSSHNHRGILIVAEPGFGKSSIMRRLISASNSSHFIHKNVVAYHFCKFDEKETRNVGLFVKKIVNMLAHKIPEMYRMLSEDKSRLEVLDRCENQPHTCFRTTMLEPLQNLAIPPKSAFIIIDALDECREIGEENFDSQILQMLHSKGDDLPIWMKFIFTSRNVTTVIGKLSEIDVSILQVPSTDKRNLMDIRNFIENTLELHPSMILEQTELNRSIDILDKQAQGNFLFIKTVFEVFKETAGKSTWKLYEGNPFPQGGNPLGRLYALSFRERYKESDFEQMQSMLEVLLAFGAPLKLNTLQSILDSQTDFQRTLRFEKKIKFISPYLTQSDDGTVRFFHQSFADWLMSQTKGVKGLFIQKSMGHRLIAEYFLNNVYNASNKPTLKQLSELSMHVQYAGMIKAHIDKLLEFNISQIRGGNVNRTILHDLAEVKGSTEILDVFIKQFNLVDIYDEGNYTPSFYAAQKGNIDNLELLIASGADVNYVNDINAVPSSPINTQNSDVSLAFISAKLGSIKMARFLLESGAKFDQVNNFGQKPVHVAAKYGHTELVQILTNNGVKADNIALHHAAAKNHTEIVKYLLEIENVRDTCLPCTPGNVLSCYTSRNVSINQTHLCFCETALHAAVSKGYIEIVKLLLRYGNETLECKHHSGKTPLMDAVERDDKNMVELLLRKGADVNAKCINEVHSRLGLRYERFINGFFGDITMEKFLYTSYGDKLVCYNGMAVIHLCARQGLWEMTEYLASSWNVNLLAIDNSMLNIIGYAAIHDQADFIMKFRSKYPTKSALLSNVFGEKGTLRQIVVCGSIQTLQLFNRENNHNELLEKYDEGTTLLHLATMWYPYPRPPTGEDISSFKTEIFSCTDKLIDNDCLRKRVGNVEQCLLTKKFKLEYEKRLKVVKLLTKLMGNIDIRDESGRTALHYAAFYGFVGAVRHLVRQGSDWRIKDNDGTTVLKMALTGATPLGMDNFFRMPCQFAHKENFFQSCKSAVYDNTISYLIRLLNTSMKRCNNETKLMVKHLILRKLHLSLHSIFENGVNLNCGDGFLTHLNDARIIGYNIGKISEIFKIFQINVSEKCGGNFVESEIHLMSYLGMPSNIGNFFKPSHNNHSFPLQRLVLHHPKAFRFLDECYDKEGYLPIHRAVQGGNIDAIRWFFELGIDMWRKSKHGWNALGLAIYHLVPERFENRDFKKMKYIEQLSILHHFYFVHHVHHGLLMERLTTDPNLDHREGINLTQNTRKRLFDTLVEKAFTNTVTRNLSIFQSWCRTDSTELSPLHFAASLGLEMLDDIRRKFRSVTNRFPLRCRNKHNIEPLYLAYLYDSVEADRTLKKIFLEAEYFTKLALKYPVNQLQYPSREAEYHMIYNYFYQTPPDTDIFLDFELEGLFQCQGINNFLPDRQTLDKTIERCYSRCRTSVFTAADLFFRRYPHPFHKNVFYFDEFFDIFEDDPDFYNFNMQLSKIKYFALKVFYNISTKLWRQISEAHECSYRCRCAEIKPMLLEHFTSEPREQRKVGKFVAERMKWANTSFDGDVQYRWPFKFLLNKAVRKDKDYDYLKIFGNNFKPALLRFDSKAYE